MELDEALERIRALARPGAAAGMARFGIRPRTELVGVSVTDLRRLARTIGTDHRLAGELWTSGIHEARILATLVEDPARVTEAQMDRWAESFDSWDVCDQCCANLFSRTPFAEAKAVAWTARDDEFVKRAGFALMASLAVGSRGRSDETLLAFLPVIESRANDERPLVRKAASWALRQIGKRNARLHRSAVATAERIGATGGRAERWVASDVLRELNGDGVRSRLGFAARD